MFHDVGRPLDELRTGLEAYALPKFLAEVIAQQAPRELEVQNDAGQRYLVSGRPYRAADGQADGVVVTLFETTDLRAAEEALKRASQRIVELEMVAFSRGEQSN